MPQEYLYMNEMVAETLIDTIMNFVLNAHLILTTMSKMPASV